VLGPGRFGKRIDSEERLARALQIQSRQHAHRRQPHRILELIGVRYALVTDRGHTTINFEVTSGAVYIVRNPLDIAISFAHHLGASVDHAIKVMAEEDHETPVTEETVYEVYGSWRQHVESWTRRPHRAVHVMRYEDVLDNPTKAFGALARHLLLRPTPEQLEIAIARSSFDTLRAQEERHGFREKPDRAERFFREGKAGQWREKLTRRQIRQIVATHSQQMRKFGYITPEIEHLVRAG